MLDTVLVGLELRPPPMKMTIGWTARSTHGRTPDQNQTHVLHMGAHQTINQTHGLHMGAHQTINQTHGIKELHSVYHVYLFLAINNVHGRASLDEKVECTFLFSF